MNNVFEPKSNSWFMPGTLVVLIDDFRPLTNAGLFLGTRLCENPKEEGHELHELYIDQEICMFNEFTRVIIHGQS